MPSDEWVVLRAVHPSWCTAQVPAEVADLLGTRVQDLEGLQKPGRALAFLDRGPGTLRVIGGHRSAELMAREMAQNRVVGVAQLSSKLVFSLPGSVERHLEIVTYPRGEHSTRGTDDTLAWLLPRAEYYEYREATREDRPFSAFRSGEVAHVYLTRSLFPGLRPPLSVLERSGGADAGGASKLRNASAARPRAT